MTFVINVEFRYVNMGAQVEFVGRNAAQRYAFGGGGDSCRELYYTTTLASERTELIFCRALKDCQFAAVCCGSLVVVGLGVLEHSELIQYY